MAKPRVKVKINKRALRDIEREVASKLSDESMEYHCVNCGTSFHPSDGRIVCPECGMEYVTQT